MKPSKVYQVSRFSIIDKKQWLTKVSEPSENYLHLLIDSLMYAKHKILCGHGMDSGLADFLRKVKSGLLKVVQCPDFLNKAIAAHAVQVSSCRCSISTEVDRPQEGRESSSKIITTRACT